MDQGLITNPKDLERMQGELESLQRRITSLEDDELEVMARLEDAEKNLDSLTSQVADADERLAELAARATAGPGARPRLASRWRRTAARRRPGMPEDLMALYDKLRAQERRRRRCAPRPRVRRVPALPRPDRAGLDPQCGAGRGDPARGVPADPRPDARVRSVTGAMTGPTSVIIEADGGSRGNPGPAAYGAVLKDAVTGEVIAEDGTTIGRRPTTSRSTPA